MKTISTTLLREDGKVFIIHHPYKNSTVTVCNSADHTLKSDLTTMKEAKQFCEEYNQ